MPICIKEFQTKKRNNQAKMQGNEHIRGLICGDFIFVKRGMQGTLIIGSNPSANVCQVLMYVNAILCQGIPGHVRDYRACQHMLGECYAMLGNANMCLGVLLRARCSRYKDVPRHARCEGMLV